MREHLIDQGPIQGHLQVVSTGQDTPQGPAPPGPPKVPLVVTDLHQNQVHLLRNIPGCFEIVDRISVSSVGGTPCI